MLTPRNLLALQLFVLMLLGSQKGAKQRQQTAANYERVRETDVSSLRPAFYAERLPDGLSGVDPYQGYTALRIFVERLPLFEREHLVRVDRLPRQEEEVRVFTRPLVPDWSLGRYGR
jgi:hypothetical protein